MSRWARGSAEDQRGEGGGGTAAAAASKRSRRTEYLLGEMYNKVDNLTVQSTAE